MICKECGHKNEGAGKFCANCGAKLEILLTCPTCGATYPEGTKFCPEDGTKLGEPPKPAEPICPKCGTTYPIGTKFCLEDGTKLPETTATAAKPEPKGQKLGDSDLRWYLDEATGTLTISGKGAMPDYKWKENTAPWQKVDNEGKITGNDLIKKLIIEEGITSVGYGTFIFCKNLTEAKIADSVERIGGFQYCSSLTSISSNAKLIADGAFSDCSSLKEVKLEFAEKIDERAFYKCKNLVKLESTERLKEICWLAFNECERLSYILLDGVKKIEKMAFQDCNSLITIDLPDVVEIEERAFIRCSKLTSITFGKNIKIIGSNVFNICDNLRSIVIDSAFPPVVAEGKLGIGATVVLYVPKGSEENYALADGWKNLKQPKVEERRAIEEQRKEADRKKQAAAAEKERERQAAAAEKERQKLQKQTEKEEREQQKEDKASASETQHRFKTSQGKTFCQYCGKDDSWYDTDCQGKKHGHNYVYMKNKWGEWDITCNKCGKDSSWAEYPCGGY